MTLASRLRKIEERASHLPDPTEAQLLRWIDQLSEAELREILALIHRAHGEELGGPHFQVYRYMPQEDRAQHERVCALTPDEALLQLVEFGRQRGWPPED
jgi:hypothetical protein